MSKKKTIKIRQVRSAIGAKPKQRQVLRTLGLRRVNTVVERQDTEAVRGAVAKIPHMVQIVGEES